MKWTILVVATTLVLAACEPERALPFAALDQNRNGRISKAEAAEDSLLSGHFASADADGDGELSAVEYLQAARTINE